ncbi:MAG TPA: hypothetical protein VMI72_10745 [Roseiarcus sp.]|nr:hypothetical protein [Roseiarcus sp.]
MEARAPARLDENDPGFRRVDGSKIDRKRFSGGLGDRTGHLDSRRARAYDDKTKQPAALILVRLGLRLFEGE